MKESQIKRVLGRIITGGYYDHQEIRKSQKNRIRDIVFRIDSDLDLTEVQEKKEKPNYSKDFNDNNIMGKLEDMKDKKKIGEDEYQYIMDVLEVMKSAEQEETNYKKLMREFVESEKIYKEFLEPIIGISGILSANLIKIYGHCENAQYVSSMWKYSGLAPEDGALPKRKKGQQLNYNTRAKTVTWLVADSFIKQRTPVYRELYDNEKARQLKLMEDKAENAPKSLMHAHLRGMVKMRKLFLSHYWGACKDLYGGEKPDTYVHQKLGHKGRIDWQEVVRRNVAKTKSKRKSDV